MTTSREPDGWDGRNEFLVTCRCATTYRTEARVLFDGSGPVPKTYTRIPCPSCGGTTTAVLVTTDLFEHHFKA